jgi:predicted RNase H-like HicB family nuclease
MTWARHSIVIEKEGKQYFAYLEKLPGVYGLGASIAQAKTSILRAIRLFVAHHKKIHRAMTPSRTTSKI